MRKRTLSKFTHSTLKALGKIQMTINSSTSIKLLKDLKSIQTVLTPAKAVLLTTLLSAQNAIKTNKLRFLLILEMS